MKAYENRVIPKITIFTKSNTHNTPTRTDICMWHLKKPSAWV